MLVGQPELKYRLKQHSHNPLSQRIAVNFFLPGLTYEETRSYIMHHLKKVGGNPDMFSMEAVDMIYRASRGIPRTINLLCDAVLIYGFGYEFEIIEAPVIEQVIKDKGEIEINTETENKMGPFSFCNEQIHEGNTDRLQQLEDPVIPMKCQVDYVVGQMTKLEEKVEGFQENLDGTLKILFEQERNRNNKLLAAYLNLKAKYDNLRKLWEREKETSAPDDSDIILLKHEFQRTN